MKMLQSPLFIHFYGSRTEGNIQYLFLEYASGGELFDRIGVCMCVLALVACFTSALCCMSKLVI
jgi:hypothetical protein